MTQVATAEAGLVQETSYETVFGGKDQGLAVEMALPLQNLQNWKGAPNQAGSLKWVDDPELTQLSGPYAHFSVTKGDWGFEVNGRRKHVVVNVHLYGNEEHVMSLADKKFVGRLEIVVKHTACDSFLLINLHQTRDAVEGLLELTSSTKKFSDESGWQSFSTEEMGPVRIAVKAF